MATSPAVMDRSLDNVLTLEPLSAEFWSAAKRYLQTQEFNTASATIAFSVVRARHEWGDLTNLLVLIRMACLDGLAEELAVRVARDPDVTMHARFIAIDVALHRIQRWEQGSDPFRKRGAVFLAKQGALSDAQSEFIKCMLTDPLTPSDLLPELARNAGGVLGGPDGVRWLQVLTRTVGQNPNRLGLIMNGFSLLDPDERIRLIDLVPELVADFGVSFQELNRGTMIFLHDATVAGGITDERRSAILQRLARLTQTTLHSSPLESAAFRWSGASASGSTAARQQSTRPSGATDLNCSAAVLPLQLYLLYVRFSADERIDPSWLEGVASHPAIDVQAALVKGLGELRQSWAITILSQVYQHHHTNRLVHTLTVFSATQMADNGVPGAEEFLQSITSH